MPTPLARFTSSSATVVPERRNQQVPSNRVLRPQDSLERRINSAIGVEGGDDGLIGLLQGQDLGNSSLAGWSFLRDSQGATDERISRQALEAQDIKSMDMHSPQSPPHTYPYPSPPYHLSNTEHDLDYRRPSTSTSWHSASSSMDGSSDLYSTTDVDTEDEEMSCDRPALHGPNALGDLGLGGMGLDPEMELNRTGDAFSSITDYKGHRPYSNAGLGAVSPQDLHGSTLNSPVTSGSPLDVLGGSPNSDAVSSSLLGHAAGRYARASTGGARHTVAGSRNPKVAAQPPPEASTRDISEEEQKRRDRVEHRRDINRRSAQKHRLRRKEEVDSMQRQISSRDAKIRELERDLAVEKARSSQLRGLLNSRLGSM